MTAFRWMGTDRGLGGIWLLLFAVAFVSGSGCGTQRDKRRRGKRRSYRRHRRGTSRRFRRRRTAHRPGPDVRPGDWAWVAHVIDGDTVFLDLRDKKVPLFKARLAGVNAPECHKRRVRLPTGRVTGECRSDEEYFGFQSFKLLERKVEGRLVKVDCPTTASGRCRTGSFGRPLVRLLLPQPGGTFLDVGEWLVEQGGAWPFTKYASRFLGPYCLAEERAWRRKAGMWKMGRRWDVLAKMSKKTRKWYALRDKVCKKAVARMHERAQPGRPTHGP